MSLISKYKIWTVSYMYGHQPLSIIFHFLILPKPHTPGCFQEFDGLERTYHLNHKQWVYEKFKFPKCRNNLFQDYSFYYIRKLANKISKFIQKHWVFYLILAKRQALTCPSFRSFYCANVWKLWTVFFFMKFWFSLKLKI